MKKSLLLIFVLSSFKLQAQTQNDNVVNEEIGVLHQKQLTKAPVEGSYYLTDAPEELSIIQKDSLFQEDVLGRYNIRDDRFEIGSIVISGSNVISFKQKGRTYIRGIALKPQSEQKDHFFVVLHQGKFDLLLSTSVRFKPSDYNLIMDTGSRNDTYFKEDFYYLFQNEELLLRTKSVKKVGKFLNSKNKKEGLINAKIKTPKNEVELLGLLSQLN